MLLLDPSDFTPLVEITTDLVGPPWFSWSSDATRLSVSSMFGTGTTVYDLPSGEAIQYIPSLFFSEINDAGTMLASGDFETNVVMLHDVESGQRVDRLTGLSDNGPWVIEFLSDGRRVAVGASGDVSAVWDITTGEVESFLPQAGRSQSVRYIPDRDELLVLSEMSFSRWDMSGLANDR